MQCQFPFVAVLPKNSNINFIYFSIIKTSAITSPTPTNKHTNYDYANKKFYAFQHTFLYNFFIVRQTCRYYKKTIDPDFCSIIAQNLHCNHGSNHPPPSLYLCPWFIKNKMLSWYLSFLSRNITKPPPPKVYSVIFLLLWNGQQLCWKVKTKANSRGPRVKKGTQSTRQVCRLVLKFKGFYCYLKYLKNI